VAESYRAVEVFSTILDERLLLESNPISPKGDCYHICGTSLQKGLKQRSVLYKAGGCSWARDVAEYRTSLILLEFS
jgi:hypothetical protein